MLKELNYSSKKLKCYNGNEQYATLESITASIHNISRDDLYCLLDAMKTTTNNNIKIKIFALFCSYLLSNDSNVDILITCDYAYTSINNILKNNPSRKTNIVLHFLTLLLHADCGELVSIERQDLVMHVKNMIRTSGCLATMSDIFACGMMHQDTWKALCQCLAGACSGCEINQNYSTHIIPMCIHRCKQGDADSLILLQNLLQNHERNIQMFIQMNGMAMFYSESILHYSSYLQLLHTVIQKSSEAITIAQKSNMLVNLHEILRTHGSYSQIGQWATVILCYANSIIQEINKQSDEKWEPELTNETIKNILYQNLDNNNDTEQLFHNIEQEIVRWQSTNIEENRSFQSKQQADSDYNLTFNFLQNWKYINKNDHPNNACVNDNKDTVNYDRFNDLTLSSNLIQSRNNRQVDDLSDFTIERFKSLFSSTPKKKTKVNEFYMENGNNKHSHEKVIKKNKSFSSRLLSVIYNSCGSILNRVLNIFKFNNSSKSKSLITNHVRTRYKVNRNQSISTADDTSCKTCKDTFQLKTKMLYDKNLKRTVQKLKLGINIYGCDFKKISKVMWPRESYMTPKVLYNLYRKLIIK